MADAQRDADMAAIKVDGSHLLSLTDHLYASGALEYRWWSEARTHIELALLIMQHKRKED